MSGSAHFPPNLTGASFAFDWNTSGAHVITHNFDLKQRQGRWPCSINMTLGAAVVAAVTKDNFTIFAISPAGNGTFESEVSPPDYPA